VLSDESAVSSDQQQVTAAASALDAAVNQLLASGVGEGSSGSRSAGSSGTGSSHNPSSGSKSSPQANRSTPRSGPAPSSRAGSQSSSGRSGEGGGSGSSGRSGGGQLVSSAQITEDKAAVDAAEARAQTADLALKQADLVSPLTGTVGQVNVKPGSSVSAGSTSPAFVILGPGGDQAVIDVPSTSIGSVQLAQSATVLPDGQASPMQGTVVAIGLLPTASTSGGSGSTSSTSSTPTYPVSVALSGPNQTPFAGSGASVDLVVATAEAALSVPTSAVRTIGGSHAVTVLHNGKARTVPIQVGAVGPTETQVLSGLQAGDRVVLANATLPLPMGSTSVRGLTGGGFGSAGGAGARGGAGGRTG
jgi:HlyD family secretion protein